MNSLIKKFAFLFFLLPLFALAENCEQTQGPITLHENFWKKDPKWICPGGKLVIKLDASNYFIRDYIILAVKDGAPKDVTLTYTKRDPGPNPQISFPISFPDPNTKYSHDVQTVTQTPKTDERHRFDIPSFYTGKLESGLPQGDPGRQLIITNSSDKEICLYGYDAESSNCGH